MSEATITTNRGAIGLDLFDDDAPKTVENFVKLSTDGFYDGVIFHRVIPDFMIQGGDPIVTADACPWLNGLHTVFGRVTSGMDVVDEIGNTATDGADRPLDEVRIESVAIDGGE